MSDEKSHVLPVDPEDLERYLTALLEGEARVSAIRELERGEGEAAVKQYGYGVRLLIEYLRNGNRARIVFHTLARNGFGHERAADRALTCCWTTRSTIYQGTWARWTLEL